MTKVAASILSADFANLHKDCTRLLEAGADVMHFDVMDGHFVPNISYGAPVLTCLHAALPDVFYDVHLMISDPARYAADFAKAGADLITFHLEAVPDTVEEVIAAIAVGAVREVEGVSGMMGNLGTSVADLVTNKKGAQKNAKGVKIEMTETGLVLDIYLTVAYGHAIPEVAENAQKAVASAVSDMTGCTVETVNIHVGGVTLA